MRFATSQRFGWWRLSVCLFGLVWQGTGCREERPAVRVRPLEGRVQKIETGADGTGRITVAYRVERDGREEEAEGVGEVNSETEIVIDGVVSKLEDIRVGERIHGEVKLLGQAGNRRQLVLRIHVERARELAPASSGRG